MGLIRRIRSSLFLKILLVFSTSLVLMVVFIAAAHRLMFKPPRRFESILNSSVAYARLIARDLGNPPALERARDLSQRLHLHIQYESPSVKWSTHRDMEDISREEMVNLEGMGDATAGFTSQGLCALIPMENGELLFLLRPRRKGFLRLVEKLILYVSILSILLIVGVWFIIQALLRPIRTLSEGMGKLGEGDINYRMESRRRDELGGLIRSFNRMSDRIVEMIRSRDRMLLDVSHEMRSPLTRIKLALEFLEEGAPRQAILEDVEDVERMITVILETERLDSPHGRLTLQEMNLYALVSEIVPAYSGKKPGVIIRELSPDIHIHGDAERVRILLRNLLDNALRHSSESSQPVEITGECIEGKPMLRIRDFGGGMAPEDLAHIFEPFYRADRSRNKKTGGYGLGMSMCRKIMQAHGGTIQVDSSLGEGTSITLKFPA